MDFDVHYFRPQLAYCSTRLKYQLYIPHVPDREPSLCRNEPVDTERTRQEFNSGVQAWRETEEYKRIETLLHTETLPAGITKIVAFALGDIGRAGSGHSRSICQHALILCVRDALNSRLGPGQPAVRCFAQDPAYREVDKQVLGEAGITVVGDPRGFLEVDDNTVVISISPNIPVRQITADIARPAVLMWNVVKDPPSHT